MRAEEGPARRSRLDARRGTRTQGDIGFDPAGLKPSDPAEFADIATKELQNGRVAMLAIAGFVAQELVNGLGIVENF